MIKAILETIGENISITIDGGTRKQYLVSAKSAVGMLIDEYKAMEIWDDKER